MKIATIIVRTLLGLAFVFFGLNAFFGWMKPAEPPTGLPGDFFRAIMESHYIYAIGAMQVLAGVMLLVGKFVPLGLTILAAVIYNILAFHAFLAPADLGPAIVVTVMEVFLIWRY